MTSWTTARLLAVTADYLAGRGSSSPRLDAELLLAETLGVDRVTLYTEPERPMTGAELDAYRVLVARRGRREPVAYILGRAAFRYLELGVTPDVLIPRPETEELVDAVLAWLRERPLLPASSPEALIADVGTGSGAIALSLASEARVPLLAIDRSGEALAVARQNAERSGLEGRVAFRQADLLEGVAPASLRVVVSNPPYVAEADYQALQPEVRDFEPSGALLAGEDGLAVYRRLVPQAAAALGPGGALFLEVGDGQAEAVRRLAREAGFVLVEALRDLSGKDRMIRAVGAGAVPLPLEGSDEATTAILGSALRAGGIIGVPTDTVYGLAAAWDSPAGVRRLFEAKGRGSEQPVAVLFSSVAAVEKALPDLDEVARDVLRALLPGPFTFVVGTDVPRPPLVGTEDSLGVRVPDAPGLLAFLGVLGLPLAATSANPSGVPAPAGRAHADPVLLACCVAALEEAPPLPDGAMGAGNGVRGAGGGLASTVVDLRPLGVGAEPAVLREGAVASGEVLESIARAVAGRLGPRGRAV